MQFGNMKLQFSARLILITAVEQYIISRQTINYEKCNQTAFRVPVPVLMYFKILTACGI